MLRKKEVYFASPLFKIGSLFCYLYETCNRISSRFKVYIVHSIAQWEKDRERTEQKAQ